MMIFGKGGGERERKRGLSTILYSFFEFTFFGGDEGKRVQ